MSFIVVEFAFDARLATEALQPARPDGLTDRVPAAAAAKWIAGRRVVVVWVK